VPTTLNPNISNAYAASYAAPAPVTPAPTPMASPVPQAKSTDLAPQGESKEYVIVPRDTMSAIAHKNGISLKALTEANPGVNPTKLQVGQKLQIPGGTAAMAASTPGSTPGAGADAASADASVYMVKSGDTLSKIAKSHGTTFKKIMAMNDLKTTSIRAGQKLKLPASKASTTDQVAAPASASIAPASATPPAKVSSTVPATASPVAAN